MVIIHYIETITFYKFKNKFCPLLIIIRITVCRGNWNFCVLQHTQNNSRRKNRCIVSLIPESDMNDRDDVWIVIWLRIFSWFLTIFIAIAIQKFRNTIFESLSLIRVSNSPRRLILTLFGPTRMFQILFQDASRCVSSHTTRRIS